MEGEEVLGEEELLDLADEEGRLAGDAGQGEGVVVEGELGHLLEAVGAETVAAELQGDGLAGLDLAEANAALGLGGGRMRLG